MKGYTKSEMLAFLSASLRLPPFINFPCPFVHFHASLPAVLRLSVIGRCNRPTIHSALRFAIHVDRS